MSYTLPVFLAHAIKMENEAAERYLELADMMVAHNNLDVAKLFRDMNHFSILHRDSIKEHAADVELPEMRATGFRWGIPPEVADEDAFDYMLDPFHALQFARENEQRAAQFYPSVADDTLTTRSNAWRWNLPKKSRSTRNSSTQSSRGPNAPTRLIAF